MIISDGLFFDHVCSIMVIYWISKIQVAAAVREPASCRAFKGIESVSWSLCSTGTFWTLRHLFCNSYEQILLQKQGILHSVRPPTFFATLQHCCVYFSWHAIFWEVGCLSWLSNVEQNRITGFWLRCVVRIHAVNKINKSCWSEEFRIWYRLTALAFESLRQKK